MRSVIDSKEGVVCMELSKVDNAVEGHSNSAYHRHGLSLAAGDAPSAVHAQDQRQPQAIGLALVKALGPFAGNSHSHDYDIYFNYHSISESYRDYGRRVTEKGILLLDIQFATTKRVLCYCEGIPKICLSALYQYGSATIA